MFQRSQEQLESNTLACESIEDIGKALEDGKFAVYEWDKSEAFEAEIKEKFKATIRCIPEVGQFTDGLLECKNSENVVVVVGRAF